MTAIKKNSSNTDYYWFSRAVWISVAVLIIMTGLACINGLVMYAVYANCDPLTAGEIQRNDQVRTDKRDIKHLRLQWK